MDTDTAVGILKVASVLIGAALGIAGLLANYRDNYGRLSRAGMAVLSGMIISAVVGVATSSIESYKASQASKEQIQRTEALLRELSRSVLPIKELSITYWIDVPPATEGVANYIKRMEAGVLERLALLSFQAKLNSPDNPQVQGLHAWAQDSNGHVLNVKIGKDSDLWPRPDEVPAAWQSVFPLQLDVFRSPIIPEKYYPMHGASDFGAMSFLPDRLDLDWDLRRKKLRIVGSTKFDKTLWKSNGRFASIVDLYGAQLLLALPGHRRSPLAEKLTGIAENPQLTAIQSALRPKTIMLDFGEGHSYWVSGRKFSKVVLADGSEVFSVTFPKSESDFSLFTKSSDED